jgi:hypothetical protein
MFTLTFFNRGKVKHYLLLVSMAGLILLFLPKAALADSPAGAEKCVECHEEETAAWENSPHAWANILKGGEVGAACEDCHAEYVKDHEESAGYMQLNVDSSICADCHTNTFENLEASAHAEAGVECIGCHLSHSQEFRLTDDSLCGSCHRDELESFSHTTHNYADIACTDCHHPESVQHNGTLSFVSTGPEEEIPAPTHDFSAVSTHNCASCHDVMTVHQGSNHTSVEYATNAQIQQQDDQISTLATELKTTKQANKSLTAMVFVGLGIGMGIGGMLGAILMLVIGYVTQKKVSQ